MCSFHQYLLVCLNNARLSSKQERANIFARLKVQDIYIYIMYIETGDSGIFFGHIHPCSLVVLSDSISGGAINGRSMGTKLDTQQLWWFPAKSDLSISGSQSPELWPIVGCCRFKPPLHFRTVWESMATENVVWVFATVQSCSIHILDLANPKWLLSWGERTLQALHLYFSTTNWSSSPRLLRDRDHGPWRWRSRSLAGYVAVDVCSTGFPVWKMRISATSRKAISRTRSFFTFDLKIWNFTRSVGTNSWETTTTKSTLPESSPGNQQFGPTNPQVPKFETTDVSGSLKSPPCLPRCTRMYTSRNARKPWKHQFSSIPVRHWQAHLHPDRLDCAHTAWQPRQCVCVRVRQYRQWETKICLQDVGSLLSKFFFVSGPSFFSCHFSDFLSSLLFPLFSCLCCFPFSPLLASLLFLYRKQVCIQRKNSTN